MFVFDFRLVGIVYCMLFILFLAAALSLLTYGAEACYLYRHVLISNITFFIFRGRVLKNMLEVRNVFNECREINSLTWNPSEGHSAMDMEVLYISSLEFDKTAEIKIKSNRYSTKLLTILI